MLFIPVISFRSIPWAHAIRKKKKKKERTKKAKSTWTRHSAFLRIPWSSSNAASVQLFPIHSLGFPPNSVLPGNFTRERSSSTSRFLADRFTNGGTSTTGTEMTRKTKKTTKKTKKAKRTTFSQEDRQVSRCYGFEKAFLSNGALESGWTEVTGRYSSGRFSMKLSAGNWRTILARPRLGQRARFIC